MTTIQAGEIFRKISAALSPDHDVMVHAALRRLGPFVPGVEITIDALFAAVGRNSTVLMITDTRSFAKIGRLDVGQRSGTDLLTENFEQSSNILRSLVSMMSFAVQGARQESISKTITAIRIPPPHFPGSAEIKARFC